MKATLTFNLYEEQEEFEHACKGSYYNTALEEIRQFVRQKLKYSELSELEIKIYEEVQEAIYNAIEGAIK